MQQATRNFWPIFAIVFCFNQEVEACSTLTFLAYLPQVSMEKLIATAVVPVVAAVATTVALTL